MGQLMICPKALLKCKGCKGAKPHRQTCSLCGKYVITCVPACPECLEKEESDPEAKNARIKELESERDAALGRGR